MNILFFRHSPLPGIARRSGHRIAAFLLLGSVSIFSGRICVYILRTAPVVGDVAAPGHASGMVVRLHKETCTKTGVAMHGKLAHCQLCDTLNTL